MLFKTRTVKMHRMYPFIACILFCSSAAQAQQEQSDEIASRLNRIVAALRVARVESSNVSSKLDIVPEQAEQIAALTVDYKAMLQEYAAFIDNDNQPAALSIMASNMPRFENRLHSEILIPHQSELLTKLVFADLLKSAGGNLLRSISTNYAKEFGLTDDQNKKMLEIEKRVTKEVAEAERKFKKELERIATTARGDAEKTLSPRQLETLSRLTPRPSR